MAAVAQRLEMVRRIASEIEGYVVELGTDGRLLSLQLDELMAGVDADRELVVRDYLPQEKPRKLRTAAGVLADLDALTGVDLLDLGTVARALGYPGGVDALEQAVSPRGYRLLAKVPAAARRRSSSGSSSTSAACRSCWPPASTTCRPSRASARARARTVREGLSRLAESSILERYV